MNDPIVVTRNLVKRGWTDFEPKVITGLLSGSLVAFLTGILGQYGITLDPVQQKYLVVGGYFLGAYLTPSSGTQITRTISDDIKKVVKEVETHSGATVTTVTNSTPIQPAASYNPGQNSVDRIINPPADDNATAVIPSTADRFLAARAAATTPETDGH
jgi:hypothetical protein